MTPTDVIDYGAWYGGYTRADILADKRKTALVRVRFALYMALWLRMEFVKKVPSVVAVGRRMGRDHSTVFHGIKRATEMMETDADFMEMVVHFATCTEEDLAPMRKGTCKAELQMLVELHQQPKDAAMEHPEYVEKQIAKAFASAKAKHIEVLWDGDLIERGQPNSFEVYAHEDRTPLRVRDYGSHFEISDRTGPLAETNSYAKLVDYLLEFTAEKEAA